jgi:hypothetical protein
MKLHFVVNKRKNVSHSILSATQNEMFIPDGDIVQNKRTWFKCTTIKFICINGYFLTTLHHELKELSRENYKNLSRYWWLHVIRRGSVVAGLLGLRVRIPSGAWISISCECSVSQLGVFATGRSLVQRSPTDIVCVCVIMITFNRNPLHVLNDQV